MSTIQEKFLMTKVYLPPLAWKLDLVDNQRINLVVDTLENDYVFGGVATTVIFATLLSKRTGIPLRIITRSAHNRAEAAYYSFLDTVGIDPVAEVSFVNQTPFGQYQEAIPISDKELFLATSWWSSYLISLMTREPYFHIIQEDETVFYNKGDEGFFCEQVLANQQVRYIVNSKILFDYFQDSHFEQIKNNSVYFEPAFPRTLFSPTDEAFLPKKRRIFFFYARPKTERNLYYAGLRIIETAIEQGVLDTAQWDIYFGGEWFEPIAFSNGVIPQMLGKLNWAEYTAFLKRVDVAFSLLWSPHPGYIPMDVVASGGVSLSNIYRKKNIQNYSKNIICGDIISPSFVEESFKSAIELAENTTVRENNFRDTHLIQSWDDTFSESFRYIEAEMRRRGII